MLDDETKILTQEENDAMLTTKEVAGMLGIHQNTVRRWSDLGLLRSFRVSGRGDRKFRYEDITSFLDEMNEPDFGK